VAVLYIYAGDKDIAFPQDGSASVFTYCIGNGKVEGEAVINVNNAKRLNVIASEFAQRFSEFVYKNNEIFLKENLVIDRDLSLYFLSDFSCKRSELSPAFNDYCNALLLSEVIEREQVRRIIFDGCAPGFIQSVGSKHVDVQVEITRASKRKLSLPKVAAKNILYHLKAFFICMMNLSAPKNKRYVRNGNDKADLFLTRYPLHLNDLMVEDKYGAMVKENDAYLVHLLTDGFHQNLSIKKYLSSLFFLSVRSEVHILDLYLRLNDVIKNIFLFLWILPKLTRVSNNKFIIDGVDLTLNIRDELLFSMMRIPRLLLWRDPIKRFLKDNSISNFYYYLHEYSYGRFFTYMLKKHSPYTKRIGFQHGPASSRKLVYMAANAELKKSADGINSFFIPDEVLAEDGCSAQIYRNAGYENVLVMPKIYRLDYLSKIHRTAKEKTYLVAPGLHDGEFLIKSIINEVVLNPDVCFILKTHPRANNQYALNFIKYENILISDQPIQELLSRVTRVYATYSSVAIEAKLLGIDVYLIDLPGRINESPLLDASFSDCLGSMRY